MGQNTQREWTVGPVLGIFMGPYVDVGGGLRVGMVLGNDIGTTVGFHTGRIYGTDRRRWVRAGRRYPIRERRGRRQGKSDGTEQRERAQSNKWIQPLCGPNFYGIRFAAVIGQQLGRL